MELATGVLRPKSGVGPVGSVVIADAVRQVDSREREMGFVAKAPRKVVEDVLDKLLTMLEEE